MQEIIKTEDENIVIERTTIENQIDLTLTRDERDGCLLLLEEQEQIEKRLQEKMDLMDDDEIKLSALVALGNNYNEEDIRILTNLSYLTRLPIMLHVIYFNLFNYCSNDLIEKFFKDFFAIN